MKINKKFKDGDSADYYKLFEDKNNKKKGKRVKWHENRDPEEENEEFDFEDDDEQ